MKKQKTATERVLEILEQFGMSRRKGAEATEVTYITFRNYISNNNFGEIHVNRLIHFIKTQANKL